SAFVQDDFRITNSLWLTLGSKFEHNRYSGFEYQPSAQLVWNLTNRQTLWTSGARAIRQPSRSDFDLQASFTTLPTDDGSFAVVKVFGTPNRKAERLYDFEAGYRAQVNPQLSLDITTFSSIYQGLQTNEPGQPYYESGDPHFTQRTPIPYLVIPI